MLLSAQEQWQKQRQQEAGNGIHHHSNRQCKDKLVKDNAQYYGDCRRAQTEVKEHHLDDGFQRLCMLARYGKRDERACVRCKETYRQYEQEPHEYRDGICSEYRACDNHRDSQVDRGHGKASQERI